MAIWWSHPVGSALLAAFALFRIVNVPPYTGVPAAGVVVAAVVATVAVVTAVVVVFTAVVVLDVTWLVVVVVVVDVAVPQDANAIDATMRKVSIIHVARLFIHFSLYSKTILVGMCRLILCRYQYRQP
jgi:hypothetical protein